MPQHIRQYHHATPTVGSVFVVISRLYPVLTLTVETLCYSLCTITMRIYLVFARGTGGRAEVEYALLRNYNYSVGPARVGAVPTCYKNMDCSLFKSPQYGGSGGGAFNDLKSYPDIVGIRGLRIRSGNQVDSIQATYLLRYGNTIEGPKHGGYGGSEHSFTLGEGEVLTGMEGKTNGMLVDQLTFHSNWGRKYGPYGRTGRTLFKVEGTAFVAFFGRSGNLLDAIGVMMSSRDRDEGI